MDFFSSRRRKASPDELLQGQLEIAESQRRLQLELEEGSRGLAVEDERTEVGRELEIGENPSALDVIPQQFSIATSPDQSGSKDQEEKPSRPPKIPSEAGEEERKAKEAEGRRTEAMRSLAQWEPQFPMDLRRP